MKKDSIHDFRFYFHRLLIVLFCLITTFVFVTSIYSLLVSKNDLHIYSSIVLIVLFCYSIGRSFTLKK